MKAVQNVPGVGVEVVEVDEPEGDGELVRVATVGICASDLLYIGWGSSQIAGHEIAGVLEDGTPSVSGGSAGRGQRVERPSGCIRWCAAIADPIGPISAL